MNKLMDQQINTRNISIKDLWSIFLHRFWIMLIAAVAVTGGMFLYVRLTFVPEYESKATLYILKQNENTVQTNNSSDDFSLALKVVNDCDYLLKSHSVLDEVIDRLDLDIPYETLSKCVSTSNPENTRILEVTVRADSPELAKKIVDCICEIGTEKIEEAMGFSQVNLYEYGILNTNPSNFTGVITYLLAGIIAAVVTYTVFLIAFLLDDRIRTEDDIERYLGLSVLGDIPNTGEAKKHRYGYYSAYGKNSRKAYGARGNH